MRPVASTPPRRYWASAYLFFEGDIYREAADEVLLRTVSPLVEELRGRGLFQSWFFIRYNVGGSHLRLRFAGEPDALDGEVRRHLEAAAEASAAVGRVLWDPYEPEVERYGGLWGVSLAEELFEVSSDVALDLLRKVAPGDRPARFGKAMLSMLVVLYLYRQSRAAAAHLAALYGHGYLRTLVPDPSLQQRWLASFESGFDRQRDRLADYVEAAWEALQEGEELTSELDVYRDRLTPLRDRFRGLFEEGLLRSDAEAREGNGAGTALHDWDEAVRRIVPSYLHMTNNRLGVGIQEESYLSVLIHRTLAGPAPASSNEDSEQEAAAPATTGEVPTP